MFAPTPSSQHKASPVEMLKLKAGPPPGASPTRDEQESELRALLEEAKELERCGHVMQALAVRERALLVQYTQALAEIDAQTGGTPISGNVNDPAVRPIVEAAVRRARTLVLQLNAAAVRLFKADDFDSAGQLLAAAVRICDSSDSYSYFFDHWEQRLELKATTFNNLGCMERRRGRLAVALQYLRQALELPSTPSAALHLNVSGVLAQLGRDSEALYAARKAIAVADLPVPDLSSSSSAGQQQQQQQPQQQPFPGLRAVARHNLATILERGDLDQAVRVAAEAVELAEQELGAASPTTVPIRQTFNRLQTALLKRQQAELLAIEAEREKEERAREIAAAEEARKAALRKKRVGGGAGAGSQRGPYAASASPASPAASFAGGATGKTPHPPLPPQAVGGAAAATDAAAGSPTTEQQQQQQQQGDARSPIEIQAEQDSFRVGAQPGGSASEVGARRKNGFVGAVRKVPDTTAAAAKRQQQEQAEEEERARRDRSTSRTGDDASSDASGGGGGSRQDRIAAAAQRIEQQRAAQMARSPASATMGSSSNKPSFISAQQQQQAIAAAHRATSTANVARTTASEEALLGDVVNFLSHRLTLLLRTEESDTRRFAAARCIQCAMRVALAKNELARRRERRVLAVNAQLQKEKHAAHLITSFLLRLRERRRQHKVDRARAAEHERLRQRSALRIQTRARVWAAMRLLVRLRAQRGVDDAAATIIQRQMRRCLATAMVQRLRAARADARFERRGLERRDYAATIIARAYRTHRARTQTLLLRGDFSAALARDWRALRNHRAATIQRVVRGYLVRREYNPILRERNQLRRNREFTRRRINAAKLLQAVCRAYATARRPLRRLYPAWATQHAAARALRRVQAACVIQRLFRCAKARAHVKWMRNEREAVIHAQIAATAPFK